MNTYFERDRQNVPPVIFCDFCRGEIYEDDMIHYIDGFIICPECFDDFVFEYFLDRMMTGGQLLNLLKNH